MFLFETRERVIYKDRAIFMRKINVGEEKKNPILWNRKEDKCEKTGHLLDDSLVYGIGPGCFIRLLNTKREPTL